MKNAHRRLLPVTLSIFGLLAATSGRADAPDQPAAAKAAVSCETQSEAAHVAVLHLTSVKNRGRMGGRIHKLAIDTHTFHSGLEASNFRPEKVKAAGMRLTRQLLVIENALTRAAIVPAAAADPQLATIIDELKSGCQDLKVMFED